MDSHDTSSNTKTLKILYLEFHFNNSDLTEKCACHEWTLWRERTPSQSRLRRISTYVARRSTKLPIHLRSCQRVLPGRKSNTKARYRPMLTHIENVLKYFAGSTAFQAKPTSDTTRLIRPQLFHSLGKALPQYHLVWYKIVENWYISRRICSVLWVCWMKNWSLQDPCWDLTGYSRWLWSLGVYCWFEVVVI